jgi:hypothetical protein
MVVLKIPVSAFAQKKELFSLLRDCFLHGVVEDLEEIVSVSRALAVPRYESYTAPLPRLRASISDARMHVLLKNLYELDGPLQGLRERLLVGIVL